MAAKKAPGKVATHRAAKILSNPKSSKAAKSAAAKTIAHASSAKRVVKAAPKSGSVSRQDTRRAVAKVVASRNRK